MKKSHIVIISIIIMISVLTTALFLDARNLKILSSLTSINELIIKNNMALFNRNTTPNDIEEYLESEVQVLDGEVEVEKDSILKTNETLVIDSKSYPVVVFGDVKADGIIDIRDVAKAYSALSAAGDYSAYTEPEAQALDFNNNDKRDILDLIKIYDSIGKEDESITLNKDKLNLNINESEQLIAEVHGTTEEVTITWASGNENTATVDQTGLVTAVSSGETIITATTNTGKVARCRVTVNAAPRQTIAKPYLDVDTYTYTGDVIAPSIYNFESSTMYISGTTNTINAGIYEMTISIKDKEQYMWEDSTDDDITLGWIINKATREAPTVTDYFGIYDGNPHTISVLEQDTEYSTNGEVWDTTIPTRTKVGETTVYVRIMEDSNHYPSNPSTGKITITDATIEIPTSDMCEDITYNGLEQTITKTRSGGYTFSNNIQTNAGIYTVEANLEEGFKWEDNTTETKQITCNIKKLKLTKPSIETSMYVYTGSTITPTITGYDSNTMNIEGVQSSINAGTYHTFISLKDKTNTEWNDNTDNEIDLNWTINKATRDDPTVTNYIGYYDGNPHTISVVESGVEYSLDEELWVNVAPTRTEIGETTVYVRIREDGNYYASSTITSIIQINPIEIQIPTSDMCENITYNGLEQTITKTASEGYTFSNNTKVYAGIYDVDANLNAGYIWNDNTTETKKIPCEIKKLKLTIPTMDVSEYTYTGETITPTITGYDNNTMSIEGTTSAQNEGSYSIIIGIKDKDNTKWMDDTNQDIIFNWEIINPIVNKLTINPNGGNYNGTTSSTEIIEETGTKYSIQHNPTKTGYTFTGFKFTGEGTYSLRDSSKIILTGDDVNYLSRGYFAYRRENSSVPVVYNTSKNGTVSLSMESDSSSSYGYSLEIISAGTAEPGIGGFYINGEDDNHAMVAPEDNTSNVDIVRVKAKVPLNYSIKLGGISNSATGYGSKYIYSTNEGTGDWETYYFYIYTGNGNSGSFKDRIYVYLDGNEATDSNPITWNVDSVIRYTYNKDDFYSIYKFGEGTGKLTAQWQASGSRITFDPNGGTISDSTNDYYNLTYNKVYDSQKIAPYNINNTDYTIYREGYRFKGWYTSKVNDIQVFDANGSLNPSVSGYSSADKTWKKSNNKTLYARWEEIVPTKITLNKTSVSINNTGKTEILEATIIPSTAADKTVTWTSSNEAVAKVDANGKVIAMGAGTAKITATASNGIYKKCTVTVTESTNIGMWYATWNNYTNPDSVSKRENWWKATNVKYIPYLSNGTFGYYDSGDRNEVLFHLSEISDAKIDFLIFDETNNVDAEGRTIFNNMKKIIMHMNEWNSNPNHRKVYHVSAIGKMQFYPAVSDYAILTPEQIEVKGQYIEEEAQVIWIEIVNDPELGKYQYYYEGKPILVLYGPCGKQVWDNYTGDRTYGDKFKIFYADNTSKAGNWGWAYQQPVKNATSMVVMPGWRNKDNYEGGQDTNPVERNNGDTYRAFWNAVFEQKTNTGKFPKYVIINSFNEFNERTGVWISQTDEVNTVSDRWTDPGIEGWNNKNVYWYMTKYYTQRLRETE